MRLESPALRVLLKTQFGLYLFGNTLSLVGTWMQRIACSWLVWDWTGSALWVGILAACDLFPVVAVAPFAGVAADRWDRLRLNVISQGLSVLNAVALAVALAAGQLGLSAILFLVFVQGTLTAATQPSRFAMVQQMVQRQDVGAAVGLNSACVNIARLLGPAAAGALILQGHLASIFWLNAAVTVLFLAVLARIRLEKRIAVTHGGSFLAEMAEGVRHVGRTPPLRLILVALFSGGALVRSLVELMPAVAAQAFGDEVVGLAILTGSAAFGAIVSGVTVGRAAPASLFGSIPFWWALGAAAGVMLTQTDQAWLAISAAIVLGAAITKGLVSTQTYIQLTTPDHLRGRALSVFGLIARGSPAIGALGIGYAADSYGLGLTMLVAACLQFGILSALTPPMRRKARQMTDQS